MWSNIKKLISNKTSKEEILKRTFLKLEQEEEHLYHLQMSLQGQQKKLEEKINNLKKHIRKNDFDIKAAIDNENKTRAYELNTYGNTLKKERDHFLQSAASLEQKHLNTSCELSKINIQKEKISTQLMFLKTQRNNERFDIEKFLYEVFNETEISILDDDLLEHEIDIALHQNKEEKEAEKQIQSFFKEKEKKSEEEVNLPQENKIKSFFSKPKKKSPQQDKIDNFFNKK